MYFDRVRFAVGEDECGFDDVAATEQPSAEASTEPTGAEVLDGASPPWLPHGWRVVLKTNGDETFGCAAARRAAAWR